MSIILRVASLFRVANVTAEWYTGGDRRDVADSVWEMYRESYKQIGMHVSSPAGLLEYDRWEVLLSEGVPVAFNLYKTTPFGLKTGLLGSDGTPLGKESVKAHIKSRYRRPGIYGEVSHAVEKLSAGAPTVCAIHVPKVLGKPVIPLEDGVHYQRKLEGVGLVTKKLVGSPRGVPSGPEGSCPIPEKPGEPLTISEVKLSSEGLDLDLADHYACTLFG